MAEDALNGIMVMWEDFKAGKSKLPMNNRIVEPTPIEQIKADTDAYRKMLAEKFPESKGVA